MRVMFDRRISTALRTGSPASAMKLVGSVWMAAIDRPMEVASALPAGMSASKTLLP